MSLEGFSKKNMELGNDPEGIKEGPFFEESNTSLSFSEYMERRIKILQLPSSALRDELLDNLEKLYRLSEAKNNYFSYDESDDRIRSLLDGIDTSMDDNLSSDDIIYKNR